MRGDGAPIHDPFTEPVVSPAAGMAGGVSVYAIERCRQIEQLQSEAAARALSNDAAAAAAAAVNVSLKRANEGLVGELTATKLLLDFELSQVKAESDKERKELFSRLLGLNRFLDAQAKFRKVSSRLERAAASIAAEAMSAETGLAEASRGREQLVRK